jgi:16S rRNA (adenine1518-N6/adenine1519-N6)-dimethyltransferase
LKPIHYRGASVVPKKSFGQNFLQDRNLLSKIVDSASITPDDNVLEIGPGFGSLTGAISERISHFTAVELDRELAEFIRQNFPDVQLIEQDFLKLDLHPITKEKRLKIIGNIPYAITTPILFKLIDYRVSIDSAVLLMQHEVAKRLSAKPRTKEYGILAVQLQAFTTVEFLFKVGRQVFKPSPNVDSAVVRLTFHGSHVVKTELELVFRKLVRKAFAMRRKTLENNLKPYFDLTGLVFNFKQRAEELSVTEFVRLAELLSNRTTL